jgi:hydrogenase nickel incorporation protein HypA/HybF
MHEVSIMAEAVRMAVETAHQAGASRVLAIKLRIGALSGVVPEALEFAFEAMTKDTAAEGATLSVEPVAARFWCVVCQQEFEASRMFAECPRCKNPSRDLRAGRELALASVEVE